jgi:hypothetical protein
MALPLLVPLILLEGATIALAAASSKRKRVDDLPAGPTKTYTLDAAMPPMLRDQVLAALQSETDPGRLEAFARGIERQYPLAASALRTKEAMLAPPLPAPVPRAPAGPPAPAPVAPGAPAPAPPLLDWQAQLMAVPDPPRSDVLRAMMGMNDPNQLESFARSLDAQYPIAAWALRVREATLRGMTPPPQPQPNAAPANPIPAAPAPERELDRSAHVRPVEWGHGGASVDQEYGPPPSSTATAAPPAASVPSEPMSATQVVFRSVSPSEPGGPPCLRLNRHPCLLRRSNSCRRTQSRRLWRRLR